MKGHGFDHNRNARLYRRRRSSLFAVPMAGETVPGDVPMIHLECNCPADASHPLCAVCAEEITADDSELREEIEQLKAKVADLERRLESTIKRLERVDILK